jgi:hypothetical protein
MLSLTIDQFKLELRWLGKVERELGRRGRAKHPEITASN